MFIEEQIAAIEKMSPVELLKNVALPLATSARMEHERLLAIPERDVMGDADRVDSIEFLLAFEKHIEAL